MSYTVYDIVKSIYSSSNNLEDLRSRVSAIQNTLSKLRVTNIATLDSLTQHFGRLIDITKADDEWLSELSQSLSYCTSHSEQYSDKGISRPRLESSVTQHDRHVNRLIIDLISHRGKIFQDLKRQSIRSKARPESLDESHRRERYEAKMRAVSATARSPRLAPTDLTNGAGKTSPTNPRRLSGISGILGNRPPSLSLDPPEPINLDGGLPAGGSDDMQVGYKSAPVEVTVTDESATTPIDSPTKKPSLGRSGRVIGGRHVGLQRHIKRESIPPGGSIPMTDIQGEDAAAMRRKSSDVTRIGVTLTDPPVREE